MHEQGYTQTDRQDLNSTALERKNFAASPGARRCYRDQYTAVQPNQGGNSTVKTTEHLEYKQLVQWKTENLTSHAQNPDAEQGSPWSSWTGSLSTRSSWWDCSSSSHSRRQSLQSTSPDLAAHALGNTARAAENEHRAICCETNQ